MSRTIRSGHYLTIDPNAGWIDSTRDKKKWYKPDKKFKKLKNKKQRAKAKDTIIKNKELPRVYKDNDWDWN